MTIATLNFSLQNKSSQMNELSVTQLSTETTEDPQTQKYLQVVHHALEDVKAQNIAELNVKDLTNVTDVVVIASGTSTRHVKALADNVVEEAKKAGIKVLGIEGERDSDWILIDLANVIVHVMLPAARQFYDLESLWRAPN